MKSDDDSGSSLGSDFAVMDAEYSEGEEPEPQKSKSSKSVDA
jgi:hypothetical protein